MGQRGSEKRPDNTIDYYCRYCSFPDVICRPMAVQPYARCVPVVMDEPCHEANRLLITHGWIKK